ncbi:uncharacterized protein AMSG_12188 [Thecamonas trahens ATCC 50062]|uniref:TRP C-terminal domain-containing protein n=1 Tax=Thecamonas trahens ATCC 50062 TaxID=461836 RepID=A0A0L0DKH8_THETB|nr:hypothetical protein AMSG_12188 [Thecamonas trahens ATCC 50062]KNC52720.1 hypothetical protein AMSG_12188 [Thecamonas trahens ATCC 50062]|eukprot:XP_013755130.1 hypothetical protein AMSG_12188 [Thecamonas trahens ATCC 50062]
MRSVTSAVTGLECNGIGFAGEYVLFWALGPIMLAALALAFAAVRLSFKSHAARSPVGGTAVGLLAAARTAAQLRAAATKYALVTFYLFVYPLVARSLTLFACVPEQVSHPQASYLASAPWLRCGSSEQVSLALSSGAVLLLVAAAVTVIALQMRSAVVDGRDTTAYAFLYAGFVHRAWWFEGVVLARRVGVAVFASLLPPGTVFASPALQAVVVAFLLVLLFVRPNRTNLALQLEAAATVTALISVVLVQNMLYTATKSSLAAMTLLVIVLNGAVIAALTAGLLAPLFVLLRGR